MMDPAGPLSLALETLRTMLAGLTSVREFLGVLESRHDLQPAAIAAAKARMYLSTTPPPASVPEGDGSQEYTVEQWENRLRPFLLLYTSPSAGFRRTREARWAFQDRGKLYVELERNAPAAADIDPETADRTVLNQVGTIIDELAAAAGGAGSLDLADVALAQGPSRERYEETGATGQYYWTLLELNYGPD